MAASKTAGCGHATQEMLAYLALKTALYWCPACGAVCWRDYRGKSVVDVWRAPEGKRKRPRRTAD